MGCPPEREGVTGAVGTVKVLLDAFVATVTEAAWAGVENAKRLAALNAATMAPLIARFSLDITESKLPTKVFTRDFDQGLSTYSCVLVFEGDL